MANAAAASSAVEPEKISWRDLKKRTAGEQGEPSRFMLTDTQKTQAKRLYERLPKLQATIAKVTEVSGCEAMAIVTDRLPKRPRGKKSKDASGI